MNTRNGLSALGLRTGAPAISWLMHLTLSRPGLISLAAGFTDNASLPVALVRRLTDSFLRSRKTGEPALQYGSTQGDERLRRLTSRHLQRLDGRAAPAKAFSPDRMLITHGSQQLLYMVAEALCDPDDIVIVEDPTYFVYLGILQSRGIQARAVPLTRDGPDLARLEALLEQLKASQTLHRLKAFYLVSYFQNPTGVTTGFERKTAILRLLARYEKAAGHPIYLIEDAAYRELRFGGRPVKSSLAVPGHSRRVIYTGTYSKPFATGVRVGFGILPEPVFTAVLRIKGNHDFGTSNELQQLLAAALGSGEYDRHLRTLQERYGRKAEVMRRSIRSAFPKDIEVWEPQGGLYFWARLPRGLSAGQNSKLFKAALKQNVLYVPGELCYADDPSRPKPDHEMRLSFGGATEREIREGIRRLGAAMQSIRA